MRREKNWERGYAIHTRTFEHWLEFVRTAERIEHEATKGQFNGMSCSSILEKSKHWSGTSTLGEAIRLAYEGWPEGLARLEKLRDKLQIDHLLPTSQRIEERWDVAGDEPDIDRFLGHEPENMTTMQEATMRQAGKLIRIVVNRTASSGISSDRITRRGLALLIAIETMLKLGYSLELTITAAASARTSSSPCHVGECYEMTIPVLHAGDPLSMDSFAFLLMHPAVLRRLFFAVAETEPCQLRQTFGFHNDGGYGYPTEPQFPPKADLLVKWNEGLIDTDKEVVPLALSILKRVGITT